MDNYINITKNVLLKNRDKRIIDDLDVLPNVRKVLNYYRITRDEAEQWIKTSGK